MSGEKIEELLTRGVEEVIDREPLTKLLKSKRKLRIKLGIDPTSVKIHIGHAVILWKLRAFQDLGHKVIFIVGDFTGQIGDTSDKDSERPMLTEVQIRKNMKTYFQQALMILDKSKTETHYNSAWLKKLDFNDVGRLADLFGVNEFTSRENMARRLKAGKRVSLRELLYPLMQGYDSVAVKADVELGGTDQRFNLLAGRKIQKMFRQEQQNVMIMTLMEGTDGRKMSASWGNVINLTESADEMFGKVMSVSDDLMRRYFLLATQVSQDEIAQIFKITSNPRDIKVRLAREIVCLYHGQKKAQLAQENFEIKFGKGKGAIVPDFTLNKKSGSYPILDILVESKLAFSKSEARRKIKEGAVEVDGERIIEEMAQAKLKPGSLIRLGKRFAKIV
ncbi:MAG: tyrosine--tRNA ligase [Candidatus Doudnabacteria bacterium CG10_big_fil_rev_8_21_14_0_10_41_10]|uniref:Tyrosine--tRNA ligase n=1 Tax=Candidatus Doudnabacteria bacterium CG10_big_fil_rev_8_21_14_0_10_41_10 TaxID=1974551 RepID=A0A2H0VEA2_9BACT|nr:MAG: tyrosine--tRNA ligase [Candidatus Doudnabacteria bacterium CG10_big_fil_rev_8_21_14_0_10_41_10]